MANKTGNPYKDENGHYTTKENDGGACHHGGSNGGNAGQKGRKLTNDDFDENMNLKGGKTWTKYFDEKEEEAKNQKLNDAILENMKFSDEQLDKWFGKKEETKDKKYQYREATTTPYHDLSEEDYYKKYNEDFNRLKMFFPKKTDDEIKDVLSEFFKTDFKEKEEQPTAFDKGFDKAMRNTQFDTEPKQVEQYTTDKFEKDLPANMRYKETRRMPDGTVYWVTQQDFDENDLNTAKEALKKYGIDKAYFVNRDVSPAYHYQDDLDEGRGYMVDVANDKVYKQEKNPNSPRTKFYNEIEQLKQMGLRNEGVQPFYSPYDFDNDYANVYNFTSPNGNKWIQRRGNKYRAGSYGYGLDQSEFEEDLDNLQDAIDFYNTGKRTTKSADAVFNKYGFDKAQWQDKYNDFLSGKLGTSGFNKLLRDEYSKGLLNNGYSKYDNKDYKGYGRPDFIKEDDNNYTMLNWSSDEETGKPYKEKTYKKVSKMNPNSEYWTDSEKGDDYINVAQVGDDYRIKDGTQEILYVGKENKKLLDKAHMYGFTNAKTTRAKMNRYKKPEIRELGQKALDLYTKLEKGEIKKPNTFNDGVEKAWEKYIK